MRDSEAMGMMCVMLVVIGAVLVLFVVIWWRIFEKTGHGGAMSLLMLVPIVSLIMLLVLAFGDWPIQQEVRRLRRALGERDDFGGGRRYGGEPMRDYPPSRPLNEGDQGYMQ
jgi:hypothetical protein